MTPAKKKLSGEGNWLAKSNESTADDVRESATLVLDSTTEFPSTDDLPPDIIRSEVNFLVLPFFALSRRDTHGRMKTEYHATLRTGEERLEISWKVLAHQEYGYPGPFDREVHKAIEHLLSEMRPPLVNPIPLGSLYNIAKLMGLKDSGRTYQDIRQAIKRIISTVLESKGAFYRKGVGKRGTDTFHLYDRAIFLGETLPDGTIADTNYLFLGTWYLESINARYVKPLDYGFYRSLHGHVASRLYELLGVKFYRMGPHPYIKYRYSNICQLLPVTRHRYFSQAKQKLDPAHQELIRKDFFKDVEWTKIPGESNDWYVSYWPGPRAKEELSRFPRQPALTQEAAQGAPQVPPAGPLEEDEPTTPVAGKDTSRKSRTLPEFTQAQLEASKELQGLGVSKGTAEELARQFEAAAVHNWIRVVRNDEGIQDPPAYLVKALRDGWQLPESFQRQEAERKEDTALEEARQEAERKEDTALEEARKRLASCTVCKGRGIYYVDNNTVARCDHTGRKKRKSTKGTNQHLDSQAVWSQVLEKLRGKVTRSIYDTWLKDTRLVGMDGHTAIVAVPTESTKEWLERRMYQGMAKELTNVLGREVEIEFMPTEELTSEECGENKKASAHHHPEEIPDRRMGGSGKRLAEQGPPGGVE